MTVAAFIGVLTLLIAILRLQNKMPEVAAGLAWLCIALVPFCGFVPTYQGMAERYTYLAALGLVLAIVALVFHLRNRTNPWRCPCSFCGCSGAFGVLTHGYGIGGKKCRSI